jgi:hypothetical protein
LPAVLRWFTANIGVHHVRHLCRLILIYNRIAMPIDELLSRLALMAGLAKVTVIS